RLVSRPIGQSIDDHPYKSRLKPRQVELRHVRVKPQTVQPLHRIVAASNDYASALALQTLTQNAPKGVFARDRLPPSPNTRISWQKTVAMLRLRQVIVKLIK